MLNNKRKKGVSGARNTGTEKATGEFVAFLDSDDLFLPDKIAIQLEFMVRSGNLFSHTSYSTFSNNEDVAVVESGNYDMIYPVIIVDCFAATPTIMIHRDILKNKNNRFPEEFSIGEDVCLWIRISKTVPSKGIDNALTRIRMHGANAAYDKLKQIRGMGNILDFLIANFLNKESMVYIKSLRDALIDLGGDNKNTMINQYLYKSDNLQISDNDLIGNKFNGHDLHFYLGENGTDSKQLVWNKESSDENTFKISRNRSNREKIYNHAQLIQKAYSLNGVLNPIGYDILFDPLFLNTKLAHFHLMHNNIFDLQLLPIMTRLKPIVWTLHDPWMLGGHCIHHFECEKWKSHCGDCPNLNVPFSLQNDNSALNFALKKDAIKNSNFDVIVASRWMEEKVKQSPILEGKTIHVIPFGIDQQIFRPIEKVEARKKLGISETSTVILFRCDYSEFKGMDMIEHVLENIGNTKNIIWITLKSNLKDKGLNLNIREYGWVKDDELLAQLYSASDLFLMPSVVESFGMMAIEAMSCGTLPIVIEGTALPDTVNAPECGVATKRDKDEYLKAVQYYIDNEKERDIRAKKCLEFVRKNYNKDVYVEKIINVYEKVKATHEISEETKFLLEQMKKYAVSEVNNTETPSIKRGNFLWNKIYLLKHYSILFFLKYKNIVPQKIRTIIREYIKKLRNKK